MPATSTTTPPPEGTSTPEEEQEPRGGSRGRRWAVVALVALTTIATFVSAIAVWAHGVLLDTDEWVDLVGPLAEDEEVTDAVAVYLVDEVVSVLDVEELTRDALPDEAQFLAAPLTDAVQGFVTQEVEKLLETEQFATLWREANRIAHEQAVKLLRDEGTIVRTTDGEISLNLIPVIGEVLQKLDDTGLLPDSFTMPDIDPSAPVDEQVQALDDSFARIDLPDDFGQITVYQSDQLAEAQDAVKLFDQLVVLVVVLTVGLAGLSLALSTNRRRTLLQLGLSILAALVISRALIEAVSHEVLGLIGDSTDRSAARAVVDTVLGDLRAIVRWIALASLLAAAVAFFTGPSSWAVRTREAFGQLRPAFAGTPSGEEAAGRPTAPALRWVVDHRDALRIVGIALALVWLVLGSVTFGSLVAVAVALALYELVVAFIVRAVERADRAA